MKRHIKIRRELGGALLFDHASRRRAFVAEGIDPADPAAIAAALGCAPQEIGAIKLIDNGAPEALSAPMAAYIEIAAGCNLRCAHCFKSESRYNHTLSRARTLEIIDELAELGVFELRLAGFEPTTSPWLWEIVERGRARGMYLVLTTNGVAPPERQRAIIEAGFDLILVSLDGAPERHDLQRGAGSYRAALALLEGLAAAGGRAKINMTVSPSSLAEMGHVAATADRLGFEAQFIPERGIGAGREGCARLDAEGMGRIAAEVARLREAHPHARLLLNYHDVFSAAPARSHDFWLSEPCYARKNISILRNGQVFYCDFLAHVGDRYCAGNLMESSVAALWRGSAHLARYRALPIAERCQACDHFRVRCGGGCPTEILETHEVFFDALCPLDDGAPPPEAAHDARYDRVYFEEGVRAGVSNYERYRWMPERTEPEAAALVELLRLEPGARLIDFGCAHGFLVKALRGLGVDARGVDCSAFAVAEAQADPARAAHVTRGGSVLDAGLDAADWVVAKDVLEHLSLNQAYRALEEIAGLGAGALVMVPLSRWDGGRYIVERNHNDVTHNLRRSDAWWRHALGRVFTRVERIEALPPFYPSDPAEGRGIYLAR